MYGRLLSFRDRIKSHLEDKSSEAKNSGTADLYSYSEVSLSPIITEDDSVSHFKIFFDNEYTSKKNIIVVKPLTDGYSLSVSKRGEVALYSGMLTLENKKFVTVRTTTEIVEFINSVIYANITKLQNIETDIRKFINSARLPINIEKVTNGTVESIELHFINNKDVYIAIYKFDLDIILPFTVSLREKKEKNAIIFENKPFINFIDVSSISDWITHVSEHYNKTSPEDDLKLWLGGTSSTSLGPEHEQALPQKPNLKVPNESHPEKTKIVDFREKRKTFRIISQMNTVILENLKKANYKNIKYVHGSYCFSSDNPEFMGMTKSKLAKVGILVSPT